MISSLIDLILIVGGIFIIVNQIKTQNKVKVLISTLKDLQPSIMEFSAAVDKSVGALKNFNTKAHELKDLDNLAMNEEILLGLAKEQDAPGRLNSSSQPASQIVKIKDKETMMKNFFEITKGR